MAAPLVIAALGSVALAGLAYPLMQSLLGTPIARQLNRQFPNIPLDAVNIVISYQKGDLTRDEAKDELLSHGLNDARAEQLINIGFNALNLEGILTLFFRYQGKEFNGVPINTEWLQANLQEAGLNPERYSDLVEAFRNVPSLQDIITFANRDVFEPEVVDRGGLLDDLPPVYMQEAAKRGLTEEEAKWYWASHWTLPSINMGFEMKQRLRPDANRGVIFDDKDLHALFNAADIAPGYRPALEAISFRTINRVDVRRFYGLGVYGTGLEADEKLKAAYQDIGYSPADAELMAEFTKRFEAPNDKQLTRTQILEAYKNGIITRQGNNSAAEQLLSIGYSQSAVETMLEQADLEIITPEEQAQIEDIFTELKQNPDMPELELQDKLQAVPLTLKKVDATIKQFRRELARDNKRMSLAEAKRLFKLEIINEEEFTQIARYHGLVPNDIVQILQSLEISEESGERIPAIRDVRDMYEGGIINGTQFVEYMEQHGFDPKSIFFFAKLAGKPLDEQALEAVGLRGDEFVDSEVL